MSNNLFPKYYVIINKLCVVTQNFNSYFKAHTSMRVPKPLILEEPFYIA